MNLRERFEARCGKLEDKLYFHVLEMALDDQKQYNRLDDAELQAVVDPVQYPPSNHETERLDEIRERLLESMAIIADILRRRKIYPSP